jgi:hypothetical protein
LGRTYRVIGPFQIKQEVNGIMYVENGFSEKLQKMQISRANHLHAEKKSKKKFYVDLKKEGGRKK